MSEGERKLTAALEETLGGLEPAAEQVPALLGAFIDGQKTIVVADQPDYVHCRIGGNESRRVKAFNQHAGGVAQHFDLPIIIIKDKLNANVWKVIGRDITRYPDWGQVANYPYSSPYIAHHGADHSFSSQQGMGADPVWIFKRQMMPLLPHPAVSGSMGIEIGSDFYYFNGTYRWFASTGTVDFTPALPTGAMNGRFMTVYIDGTTGNPAYITGTEFNAVIPPINPGDFIEIPTADQGIAVAALFLLSGTSRIGWGEIYDLRQPHVPTPATGTFLNVFDEGSFIGAASEMDFVGAGVTSTFAASRATVTIPGGGGAGIAVQDEGSFLVTGTTLNFAGAGVVATNVGQLVTVTVEGGGGGGFTTGAVLWNDWEDWEPVWSAASAVPNNTGTYAKFLHEGHTVHLIGHIQSSGTSSGGDFLISGIPVEPTALTNPSNTVRGYARFFDEGTKFVDLHVHGIAPPGQFTLRFNDIDNFVNFSDSIDSDDHLWFYLTYQTDEYGETMTSGSAGGGGGGGVTGTTTAWMPDASPPTGTANDDEFADRSFDSGLWTEFDPDAIQTIIESESGMQLVQSSTSGSDITGIYQAIPAGDFTLAIKTGLLGLRAAGANTGIALWDDATNDAAGIYLFTLQYSGNMSIEVIRMNNYQSFNSTVVAVDDVAALTDGYLRIRRNSTTYNFDWSTDGLGWQRIASVSLAFVPDQFGVFVNNSNQGIDVGANFQFFRYQASDVGVASMMPGRRVLVG